MRRAEIIERLEKAEGPDRELDAGIDIFLFGGETVWKQANYTMEMYPASRRASKHHVGGFANEHVPLYTASLDAVIALVERTLPGWLFTVASANYDYDAKPWADLASKQYVGSVEGHDHEHAESAGATMPIALLLALFRSLEAKETGNG